MKKIKVTMTTILLLAMVALSHATTPVSTNTKVDWQKAEKNYVKALNSENVGLRQSAANHIGIYRLKGAVSDLISVLQSDKVESNRMAAALALVQIGEREAVVAVQESAIYDGSTKVAKFCEELLNASITSQDLSLKN